MHDGEHVDDDGEPVQDGHGAESWFERLGRSQDKDFDHFEEGHRHDAGQDGGYEPRHHDHPQSPPVEALRPPAHQREPDRGSDDAVGPRDGQLAEGGQQKPHRAAQQRGQAPQQQFVLVVVVHVEVDQVLTQRVRHFVPNEDGAGDLEDGGQDAGLAHGEHLGAHGGAERVGHVVGADPEGEHERHHEAHHDQPQHVRRIRLDHVGRLFFVERITRFS